MFLHDSPRIISQSINEASPVIEPLREEPPLPPTVMDQYDVTERTLPPLVGREAEHLEVQRFLLAHLAMRGSVGGSSAASSASSPSPRVLLLCGSCGAGKSTTVSHVLPHRGCDKDGPSGTASTSNGSVTIECKVTVLMDHLRVAASPGTAPLHTSNHTSRVVTRQLRPIHVNCTDLSASKLIEDLIAKMRYRQRKSDVLDAKETLLRSTCRTARSSNEAAFSEALDVLVRDVYAPLLPGGANTFAQHLTSAAFASSGTRSSTGGRSSTSSTTSSSTASSEAAASAATKSQTALAAAWSKTPLHVLVLDEADSSRSSAVLRNLFQVVQRCPFWFAMVCISNTRWLGFLPTDDQHAANVVQVVPFGAYSAEVLTKIGEIAVADDHRQRLSRQKGQRQLADSSTTASSDTTSDNDDEQLLATLAPAAASFAAKTAVLNFCGDARKVKELVRRAADHAHTTAAAAAASSKQLRVPPPAAVKPTRGRPPKRPRDDDTNSSTSLPVAQPAQSSSTATTVSLKDVIKAAAVTSRAPASSVVEHLTEHATYVLCCIVVLARRKALAAHMQRCNAMSLAAGATLQQQQQGAIDSTGSILFGDSGTIHQSDVERWYKRLMSDLRLPQCNLAVVVFALQMLHVNGLITSSTSFVCTGEWTLEELEIALIEKGTKLLSEHDEMFGNGGGGDAAAPQTNKFANVFYRLRLSA